MTHDDGTSKVVMYNVPLVKVSHFTSYFAGLALFLSILRRPTVIHSQLPICWKRTKSSSLVLPEMVLNPRFMNLKVHTTTLCLQSMCTTLLVPWKRISSGTAAFPPTATSHYLGMMGPAHASRLQMRDKRELRRRRVLHGRLRCALCKDEMWLLLTVLHVERAHIVQAAARVLHQLDLIGASELL